MSKGRQEANFAPGELKIIMIIMFYQLGDFFYRISFPTMISILQPCEKVNLQAVLALIWNKKLSTQAV